MAAAEKWFHECIEAVVSRSLQAEQPEPHYLGGNDGHSEVASGLSPGWINVEFCSIGIAAKVLMSSASAASCAAISKRSEAEFSSSLCFISRSSMSQFPGNGWLHRLARQGRRGITGPQSSRAPNRVRNLACRPFTTMGHWSETKAPKVLRPNRLLGRMGSGI